jgi:hypothetical protein
VFIEKAVFTNPVDRKDTADEQYTRAFYRELAYCPGCGKHLSVYKRKQEQRQRQRERERIFPRRPRSSMHNRSGGYREPASSQQQEQKSEAEAKPAQQQSQQQAQQQ